LWKQDKQGAGEKTKGPDATSWEGSGQACKELPFNAGFATGPGSTGRGGEGKGPQAKKKKKWKIVVGTKGRTILELSKSERRGEGDNTQNGNVKCVTKRKKAAKLGARPYTLTSRRNTFQTP